MESRKLAALLSSVVSEILLLLLLLFPSSSPLSLTPNSGPFSSRGFDSFANFFPLITHFLSHHEIAASLSPRSVSRKRKRTHFPEPDPGPAGEDETDGSGSELGGGGGRGVGLGPARSPDSFVGSFKMTASTFEWLAGLLEPLLDCRDPVGSPLNLSPELRLGVGLFRLATGGDHRDVARQFGVSEVASRFCTKQLCRVLCTNFRFWAGFPGPAELESVSRGFEALTGLPNCCGVIDCARFETVADCGPNGTIAAQIVVDSTSRILSVIAGFRGDKGRSRVLRLSSLFKDIEEERLLNSPPVDVKGVNANPYLVGDEGYPLLPWLIVPFANATTGSCQAYFNVAHSLMLTPALKTIASLRNWGVLSRPIKEDFRTTVAYIGACSILHNALLMREDYSALCSELGDSSSHDHQTHRLLDAGSEVSSGQGQVLRDGLATLAKDFHDQSDSFSGRSFSAFVA
ncbi:protein ALP1-like [Eucalyptus grandis]|uniref:protein ALP1-like n=1 Tax=Eucalyptus grandis TaxID=71139 RepID=UPI000526F899|nr:protein ALP1-like [Eucalyptus grandis]XP_010028441.1 protein ALP1-like [Eucalyptus grandis]XP_010028442.1 protein ALP1-like [Eucalyptus grandis]XP_010028443.1 protein ALP1-like [Eucalyptus grandis]XP_018718425.1 protein ALP1-like [Eucalyptus grandis]